LEATRSVEGFGEGFRTVILKNVYVLGIDKSKSSFLKLPIRKAENEKFDGTAARVQESSYSKHRSITA
jgi:hypothetical protein